MSFFGALNRFVSRLDAAPQEQQSNNDNAFGFQILRNTNPDVPLEPWFDYVIGINGRTIDNPDPNLFATEVRNCAGSTISLGVFSAKGQKIREIYLPIPSQNPKLGLSLQWTPLTIAEDVWHILDVIPNSPADVAGLLPYGDYVIGSPEGLVRGESGLGELVEDYLNRPLRLIVYNHEYNVTRPVTITPSRGWGGEGALGCVLGFGALHRIPAPLEEPPQGPGETLFATEHGSSSFDEKRPVSSSSALMDPNPTSPSFGVGGSGTGPNIGAGTELFVPANMPLSSKSPPPGSAGGPLGSAGGAATGPPKKNRRAHHAHISPSGGGGLDDYFKEGEQKSLAEDYAPTGKSGGVPPPPKAGGPPRGPPRSGGTPVPAAAATPPANGAAEDGAGGNGGGGGEAEAEKA